MVFVVHSFRTSQRFSPFSKPVPIFIGGLMCSTFQDIRKSFASLRVENKQRHREIASFLNVTEVELIDSHVGVTKLESIKSFPNLARAIRLKPSWSNIIQDIQGFGEVMSLTRNAHAVHENLSFYKHASSSDDVGMLLSDELTARLMYEKWEFGYLFEECKSHVLQRSIQFFDEFGVPVHKIFLLPHSHHWYFDELAKRWADSNQEPGILVQEKLESDQQTNTGTLTSIIKERHTDQKEIVDAEVAQSLLLSSKELKLPLIITVQSNGAKQSHDGVLDEIRYHNHWLHLTNQQFNCHLQLNQMPKICINHQESPFLMEMLDEEDFLLASITLSTKASPGDTEAWEELLEQVKGRELSLLE
jgi:putative hemin transport protein